MKRIILLLAIGVGACASEDGPQYEHARCVKAGYEPGTKQYIECREHLMNVRLGRSPSGEETGLREMQLREPGSRFGRFDR